jgi:hypothetical protein
MTAEAHDSLPDITAANRIYAIGATPWGNGSTFGEYAVQVQKVQGNWVLASVLLVFAGGQQWRQMWLHIASVAWGRV